MANAIVVMISATSFALSFSVSMRGWTPRIRVITVATRSGSVTLKSE